MYIVSRKGYWVFTLSLPVFVAQGCELTVFPTVGSSVHGWTKTVRAPHMLSTAWTVFTGSDLATLYQLITKYQNLEHLEQTVRGILRIVGRLIIHLRKAHPGKIYSLWIVLDPANFDLVVEAVILMAFSQTTFDKTRFFFALKVGHALNKCSSILLAETLKTSDHIKQATIKNFRELYTLHWHSRVALKLF